MIKKWIQFNESKDLNISEIVQIIEDILIELKDNDDRIEYKVITSNDPSFNYYIKPALKKLTRTSKSKIDSKIYIDIYGFDKVWTKDGKRGNISQRKFRTSPFYRVFKRLEDYIEVIDENIGILYYACGGDSRYTDLEKSIDLLRLGKEIHTTDFTYFGIIIH